MNDEDRQKLQSIATRLSIAQSVKNGQYVLASPISNTAPWHHQVVCYNMARELLGLDEKDTCGGGVMLALDMGCGKSRCAVDLICNYPDKFKKVLIVCPVSVIDVWAGNNIISGQFDRHATEDQRNKLAIHPVKGVSVEKKTKAAEMARFQALNARKQFICVINYESAWREPFAKWAHDVGFD